MIDHYAVLGLGPTAEPVVVKAAYRALALEYHPDRVGDDDLAHKRMAEINAAYEVLSDPEARGAFDEKYREAIRKGKPPSMPSETMSDWEVAVSYFPEIQEASDELDLISSDLSSAFRVETLRKREFDMATYTRSRDFLLDFLRREWVAATGIWDVLLTLRLIGDTETANRMLGDCRVIGKPKAVWDRYGHELLASWGVAWNVRDTRYEKEGEDPTRTRAEMLKWVASSSFVGNGKAPLWMLDAVRP